MAIMQSCCCWRSVRRGSFACGIYTGIYFLLVGMSTGTLVYDEYGYLFGNETFPQSVSFLEPEGISQESVMFNIILLVCSSCGVPCCILLVYGLVKDQRFYLIPWMITITIFSLIDIGHSLYLLWSPWSVFNPITALLYTLNFFLLCLNTYSLLCVISQYQEYSAGRGRAVDDCEHRIPAIRYAAQPTTTATSCLSSRRTTTGTTNDTKLNTSATPTESPPLYSSILASDKNSASKTPRKHVQFPDTPTSSSQAVKSDNTTVEITTGWTSENEMSVAPSLLMPPTNNFHHNNGKS